MSDVYMYTSKGYKPVEQDDVDPRQRTHCERCGAFLPKMPTRPGRTIYAVWRRDPEHGNVPEQTLDKNAPGAEYWAEEGPWWDCRRCGQEHDPFDMYD